MSKTVFNFRWLNYHISAAILILSGVAVWDSDTWGFCVVFISGAAFFVIGTCILVPSRCRFDPDALTIYYCFGMRASIKWGEIKHIESGSSRTYHYKRCYTIGYFRTKFPPHREVEIPKTRKTTALIKAYYRKNID